MKKILSLFFCLAIGVSLFATDYTIETSPAPATPVLSKVIPLVPQTSTASSVTQQVFLASELTALGASAGNITGIKFYYGGTGNNTAVPSVTRSIKVYMQEITADTLVMYGISNGYTTNYRFKFLDPGTLVHDGSITTEAIAVGEVKELAINFNQGALAWGGSKNILLTVFDVTNSVYSTDAANLRFELKTTTTSRFVHQYWTASAANKASDYLSTLSGLEGYSYASGSTGTAQDKQVRGHRYVPKTTFTIVTPVPAPTSPTSSDVTSSSATISWTAAAGADSYEVRYGTTSGSLGDATNVGNVTSYDLDELLDGYTYYFQVRTKKGFEYSAWTDEQNFSTPSVVISHRGIDFSKWVSTSSIPTSGDYYLNADVTLTGATSLTGDLNLCLNGHSIYTSTYNIVVPDEKSLAIFDNEGDGRISGHYIGNNGLYYGLISVAAGGELVLAEGAIQNLAEPSNASEISYGIYNNGTFKLSGAPVIIGNDAGIYLLTGKVITIESGKPLTNSTPYTVNSTGQTITSGWANMGGAKPSAHFTSAKSGYSGVCLNGSGEAELVHALSLAGTTDNASTINTYHEQVVNVTLASRTIISASYNTICLPFALTDAQLQDVFGSGYDLEAFNNSELESDVLTLNFKRAYTLTAGQPYLIRPAADVVNPTFEGVTIDKTNRDQTDTYTSFHGIYSPTELEGGNKNILFLGANNTLFWPESTGDIYGFRAYFEIKGGAATVARRARMSVQETAEQTAVHELTNDNNHAVRKHISNGQIIIEHNGAMYNIMGQKID